MSLFKFMAGLLKARPYFKPKKAGKYVNFKISINFKSIIHR